MSPEAKERKKARRKIRDAANRAVLREKQAAWRAANRDKCREYERRKRSTDKCKVRMSAYLKLYAANNQPKLKAYRKTYQIENRDALVRAKREYYAENKEAVLKAQNVKYHSLTEEDKKARNKRNHACYLKNRAKRVEAKRASYRRRYYKNKEYFIERQRNYNRRFPEKAKSRNHRRRMLITATANETATAFIKHIRSLESLNCYYCGIALAGVDAHIDHVTALSKGGNHCSSNMAASCPQCNTKKNNKSLVEWAPNEQPLLPI